MFVFVEVMGNIASFLLVNIIEVFSYSIFYFYFGLSHIFSVASCAFDTVYDIGTVACDVFFAF